MRGSFLTISALHRSLAATSPPNHGSQVATPTEGAGRARISLLMTTGAVNLAKEISSVTTVKVGFVSVGVRVFVRIHPKAAPQEFRQLGGQVPIITLSLASKYENPTMPRTRQADYNAKAGTSPENLSKSKAGLRYRRQVDTETGQMVSEECEVAWGEREGQNQRLTPLLVDQLRFPPPHGVSRVSFRSK